METYTAEAIRRMLEAITPEMYFLLWKAMLGIVVFNMVISLCRSISLYLRIRMSNHFSTRTLIIYDGFEGVIEEINIGGIFLKNKKGETKYVPLTKWYEGDIRYPNALEDHKDE